MNGTRKRKWGDCQFGITPFFIVSRLVRGLDYLLFQRKTTPFHGIHYIVEIDDKANRAGLKVHGIEGEAAKDGR